MNFRGATSSAPFFVALQLLIIAAVTSCSNFLGAFEAQAIQTTGSRENTMVIGDGSGFIYRCTASISLNVHNAAQMRFSGDASSWTNWEPYTAAETWTFSSAPGMKTVHGQFRLTDGSVLGLTAAAQYIEKIYLNDGAEADELGRCVAISSSGTRIAAGIPHRTVNGMSRAGAAAVFDWNGTDWETTLLIASDPSKDSFFGSSIAISQDGGWIAVGAPGAAAGGKSGSGCVYLFRKTGSIWSGYRTGSAAPGEGDRLGSSIAVFANTDASVSVAAGAPMSGSGSGSVYFWIFSGTSWSVPQTLFAESALRLGSSLCVSGDGAYWAAGSPESTYDGTLYAGSVSLFAFDSGVWSYLMECHSDASQAEERFGSAISLSATGAVLAAGSRLYGTPDFGRAFTVSIDNGTAGTQYEYLPPEITADSQFGYALSLTGSGMIAVGAPRRPDLNRNLAGALYLFSTGDSSVKASYFPDDASGDFRYGSAVAASIDGSIIAVGSPGSSAHSLPASGAVYIVRR